MRAASGQSLTNHVLPVLHNTFIQLFVLFLAPLELLFIVKHHFLLLSQDLLNDLVLVRSKLVNSVICLHSELVVLLAHPLQTLEVLVSQSERLLLPRVADFH